MKYVLALILLTLAGCAEGHPRDSALRITFSGGGLCSATAVGPHLILSAEHCFKGDRLVTINGEPAYALRLVKDGNDHVLVRVSKRFKTWARMGSNPEPGTHVQMWGNALGLSFAYREAYVSVYKDEDILYAGSDTAPGDSGSGLFAPDGSVVGVVTGTKSVVFKNGSAFTLLWTMRLKFSADQLREIR